MIINEYLLLPPIPPVFAGIVSFITLNYGFQQIFGSSLLESFGHRLRSNGG
jgi:GH24 family phage-related lysozyme (muramidase)